MRILMDYRDWKNFPHCPKEIPMEMLNEEYAIKNHDQSLKRLNERGGMHPIEIVFNIERMKWKGGYDLGQAIHKLMHYLDVYKKKGIENGRDVQAMSFEV